MGKQPHGFAGQTTGGANTRPVGGGVGTNILDLWEGGGLRFTAMQIERTRDEAGERYEQKERGKEGGGRFTEMQIERTRDGEREREAERERELRVEILRK